MMLVFDRLSCRFLLLQFIALLIIRLKDCSCQNVEEQLTPELPTVTVRGFLNFKTTVDGTVIVFTPASEAQQTVAGTKETSNPMVEQPSKNAINNNVLASKDAVPVDIQDLTYTQPPLLPDPIQSEVSELVHLGGPKVKESYLHQHLSDNAVLPATVQTNNDLETEANKKVSPSQNHYPTGLVTVLGGTHVENEKTTIFETKVIGTYIDGKYAQILQSSSKIIVPSASRTSPDKTIGFISSSSTSERKSAETKISTEISKSHTVESNAVTVKSITNTPATSSRTTFSSKTSLETENVSAIEVISTSPDISTSVMLQSSFQTTEMTNKLSIDEPTQSLDNVKTPILTAFHSSEIPMVSTMIRSSEDEEMLLSNKNLRVSSTRIRFTAPKRPSQTVRLNRFKVKLTLRQNSTDGDMTTPSEEEEQDDEETTSREMEEINLPNEESLDIGVDPAQVVYKETTITSEVTLHVGRRKSVRTLTITTSVPMKINPTDIQEITMIHDQPEMDHDAEENAPAAQSVVSRTFTTTERTHTTTLVPIFDGTSTSHHTLTESFFIMKIITAYRTLPPGDITILTNDEYETDVPEVIATTLDVAANVQSTVMETTQTSQSLSTTATSQAQVQPSVPVTDVNPAITNPLMSLGQALSNNPLAAVYLGLQQLNAHMTLYSTVTQTSTYVTTDTIYSTKTIRFYDGRTTRFRTMSDPISTKKRTVTTTITSVQPYINTQALQQQQQLQKLIAATRMQAPQPQFSTVTSVYTTATTATSLSTRIYTLIYNGFSTKFRTVTSTKVYPTTLTVTTTKEVPLVVTQPPLLPFAYPYPAA